jgi:hypothetical protein
MNPPPPGAGTPASFGLPYRLKPAKSGPLDESDIYERIVRALVSKRRGLTRTELLMALKAGSGGSQVSLRLGTHMTAADPAHQPGAQLSF